MTMRKPAALLVGVATATALTISPIAIEPVAAQSSEEQTNESGTNNSWAGADEEMPAWQIALMVIIGIISVASFLSLPMANMPAQEGAINITW